LQEVETGAREVHRLVALLDPESALRVRKGEAIARAELQGHTVWNVSSTARGGGVAEMLYPLVAYARGIGVDARWLVVGGDEEFFQITKRIHNRLHGAVGSGGELGPRERAAYERTLAASGAELSRRVRPGDVAILHDPQTAGLIPGLAAAGVSVIWRCHVGVDEPNDHVVEAWRFLRPYVALADRVVFSRLQYAWDFVPPHKRAIIAPSIDPLSPKNQELSSATASAILAAAGLKASDAAEALFERLDGTTGQVRHRARVAEGCPLARDDRYILQVSRWDRLKDPLGVIDGYAAYIAPHTAAHLVYAGPDVEAVSDDPEGREILNAARDRRDALAPEVRARVHLVQLPMEDLQENAAIVNALQRNAEVVVQKSLAEGFGLTVAEAMWKGRPVVASRVGGIEDQIVDGVSGVLVDGPDDLAAYGAAVVDLLSHPETGRRMGVAARTRVAEHFLGTHSLLNYLAVIEPLLQPRERLPQDSSVSATEQVVASLPMAVDPRSARVGR
jgi:trehalose synthase